MVWDYYEEHFIRYVNLEYWRDNYEEIIKTGFDFPKLFISCVKHDYQVNCEKRDKLIKKYYPNPETEDEYYPLLKLIKFTEQYGEFKDLIKPFAFNYPNSVALVFSRTPRYWGLRGDPYFWTYLEERFIKSPLPVDNVDILEKIIIKEYYKLSGGKRIGEEAYIKEFAHGGMSSGSISDLWLDYIPLLKYRLIELNNNYYSNHKEFSKRIQPEKRLQMTRWRLDSLLERYDEPLRFSKWLI